MHVMCVASFLWYCASNTFSDAVSARDIGYNKYQVIVSKGNQHLCPAVRVICMHIPKCAIVHTVTHIFSNTYLEYVLRKRNK